MVILKNRKLISLLTFFGGIFLFATLGAQVAQAAPPTLTLPTVPDKTANTITLSSTVNPNSLSTTALFRFWPASPGTCVDNGPTSPQSSWPTTISNPTAATPQAMSTTITGLLPNTTYYYCAVATNSGGTVFYGSDATTPASVTTNNGPSNECDVPPTGSQTITSVTGCSFYGGAGVSGMDGSGLTISSGSTLNIGAAQTIVFQSINKGGAHITKAPGGVMRKGYIYVKDLDNDNFFDPKSAVFSSNSNDATLTGQGYYRRSDVRFASVPYLSQADCNDGTSAVTTNCTPSGTSSVNATNITGVSATLNGSANPNGDAGTRAYFKYQATTNNGDCSSFTSSASATPNPLPNATTSQNFSQGISGLIGGTTYYWCSVVFNNAAPAANPIYGPIGNFVALGPPTGVSLSGITQTNITVNWTPPSGAAGFKIYRCVDGACPTTTLLATDADNASPHADTSVTCGHNYQYQVTATTGAGGAGSESSKSTITTLTASSSCVSQPTLASPTATSITGTSAILGATVTSNGGAALNARGTCWSTTDSDPRIGDAGVNCLAEGGTAVSAFSHSRTSLPSSSTVYYNGYATNTSSLTGYTSSPNSFSTPALLANGSNCTAGSECQSGNCYVDADNDRYYPASGTSTCRASSSLGSNDCNDSNATINPGATYQTSARPDNGTWDWDCSGGITANQTFAQYCSATSTPTIRPYNEPGCSTIYYGTGACCGNYNRRCTSQAAWSLPGACGKYGNIGTKYADSGVFTYCAYYEPIASDSTTRCK